MYMRVQPGVWLMTGMGLFLPGVLRAGLTLLP
jgi:hypothetical protein